MEKKFYNTPNERIQIRHTTNDETKVLDYFISRSVAVVGVVFAIPLVGSTCVLITKRSNKMRDEANKYGVPCGYFDYDETGYEAMMREVYEETSLYLPDYSDILFTNNHEKPIFIQDNPIKDKRQNVSLIYLSVYDFSGCMNRFPTEIVKYTDKETAEVMWMSLIDFYTKNNEMEWAFNHDETIKNAIKQLKNLQ